MPERPATPPFLRILLGPTASGKERLALHCAQALGADILSVDSMKIYRGLDVGTAKASAEDRARVPHHCVDIADPTEAFSVARYVSAAEEAIAAAATAGQKLLLSGGTALYYKALLEGLFDGPSADTRLREELKLRAEAEGVDALHAELKARDPVAASRVHPHDVRRVVRALEVAILTGAPISEQQTEWTSGAGGWGLGPNATSSHEEAKAAPSPQPPAPRLRYPCTMVALDWPRDMLYARIEKRVERMLAAGLLAEARYVYDNRTRFSHTPLQAVGYKEFFPHFEGEASLEESVALLKKNTRNLAKSQMTWLRKFPCTWVGMNEDRALDAVAGEVMGIWRSAELR